MRRYVYSTVNDRVQELDIAEGLKQLLRDAGLTIELIVKTRLSRHIGNVEYRSIRWQVNL